RASDRAADHAESLGKRALDDVDPVGEAVALGDASAARAIHTGGVHLVDIGHRIILVGQVGDRLYRCNVAVHGIDALEDDELGALASGRLQQAFQMRHVIVAEDLLLGAGTSHTFYHGGVVEFVREDQAVRQEPRYGRYCGLVGNEPGGENQPGLLAVQIGELQFELYQRVVGAGDIARAAGAGTHAFRSALHGGDHIGMLSHAKIVIGTPDGDLLGFAISAPYCTGKCARDALQIGENPVATL